MSSTTYVIASDGGIPNLGHSPVAHHENGSWLSPWFYFQVYFSVDSLDLGPARKKREQTQAHALECK